MQDETARLIGLPPDAYLEDNDATEKAHAANRLAPKFLQIENLSSRGKIILWRDKIPPDEKKSTALGDVPDSGNLCRNHAPNFLWRKVTDPLWRGCMPSGRSSTKTRFLQVNVDLLYL